MRFLTGLTVVAKGRFDRFLGASIYHITSISPYSNTEKRIQASPDYTSL